jgi:UDP-N-acetylglucosamine--N-acetylmuramyl-(pentapeptide) pyrophosphoryl-undecaprenol N-acetylglucosamine transferase
MTPGLANRIAGRKADKFCCNFPETVELLPKGKAIHTGTPIRQQLFEGSREKGLSFAHLSGKKPVLMIICGSLGSVAVNSFVREGLPRLIEKFDIIHLTGRGNLDEGLVGKYEGYKQFEYISDELPDLFAAADILISRAGANAICEIAALAKPNVLIPLPLSASRGDQIKNAESFEKQGFSAVLDQDNCTASDVADKVFEVYDARDAYVSKMKENASGNGAITKIADLIETLANGTLRRSHSHAQLLAQCLLSSIISFVRLPEEHGRFAGIAWDQVHMKMEYGLTRDLVVVLHDIEAVAGKHIRHVGRCLLREHQSL